MKMDSLRALTTAAFRPLAVDTTGTVVWTAVACSRFTSETPVTAFAPKNHVGTKRAAASKRAILPPR
ncbi:MAG: hypothetical protein R3C17_00670 [Planctomycetaceae bacterium]